MDHPIQTDYLRWIVFLPLIGAIINGLLGSAIQKRMGKGAISFIACAPVILAFGLSVNAFLTLKGLAAEQRFLIDRLYTWINLGSLKVDMAFWVDPLSAVMILVVTGVGGLIHIYATGYMHEDKAFWRFFAFLNLFTAAMLILVTADNLLLMFVGWEGVGLCSYALIGFWYQDHNNARAGNKAFIVNRVGDFGFVLGMFLLFWSFDAQGHGTLTIREMAKWASTLQGQQLWGISVITLATLLLFVGATGKSAQIPLHVWLPDAMAGPTPVSALIHAATMVTAGVYMIARLNFLFALAPLTLAVVATIGAATALLAATIALAQTDIKRVLAYSTVSQLGYMFLAMGVGAYAAGIFHLMTHAFFKACLFLGSGSVIHALGGEQDMRKMGGLVKYMPATSVTFIVATLAIAGIPPLAGFFSKDEILWQAFSSPHGSVALWATGVAVAGLTAFYMFRQVFMVFFGVCRADLETRHHLHESPAVMTIPLWILMAGSIVAGLLSLPFDLFVPFERWLAPVMEHHGEVHAAAAGAGREALLMLTSLAAAAGGIGLAYRMYASESLRPETFSEALGGLPYRAVLNKYWVDELYGLVFVRGTLLLCRATAWFDLHAIDGLVDLSAALVRGWSWLSGRFDLYVVDGAVNGVADVIQFVGRRVRNVQTGAINAYLYVVLLGVLGGVLLYWSWAAAS